MFYIRTRLEAEGGQGNECYMYGNNVIIYM